MLLLGCFQSATLPVLPWCAHCIATFVLYCPPSPSTPPLAHYGYLPILLYLGWHCSQRSPPSQVPATASSPATLNQQASSALSSYLVRSLPLPCPAACLTSPLPRTLAYSSSSSSSSAPAPGKLCRRRFNGGAICCFRSLQSSPVTASQAKHPRQTHSPTRLTTYSSIFPPCSLLD